MNPVDHDSLRELLGAYAIDAVPGAESTRLEEHLETCAQCRAEIDDHRSVAAMLAEADTPLPEGLWDRVRGEIHAGAHEQQQAADVIPLRRTPTWLPLLSAAAVTILVALVGVQTIRLQEARTDLSDSQSRLAAIEQAVVAGDYAAISSIAAGAPGAMTVALDGDAGGAKATILPDGSGYLDLDSLAPLDGEHTYQLWAVLDGEVISAGVFGGQPTVAPFRVDPDLLQGLVVTEEVVGGVAVSSQPAASAWLPGS